MLMPRRTTPELTLPTLDGAGFDLAAGTGDRGTVLCFYRGLHCPLCVRYLAELEAHVAQFAERGLGSIAISSDGEDRARAMAGKVGGSALRYAYDLPLGVAREWGLFISTGRGRTSVGIEEPALFAEPGLFLVNADRTLYYMSVQTMPFVRPHIADLLGAVDYAIANDYPARGEYDGPV